MKPPFLGWAAPIWLEIARRGVLAHGIIGLHEALALAVVEPPPNRERGRLDRNPCRFAGMDQAPGIDLDEFHVTQARAGTQRQGEPGAANIGRIASDGE